MRQLQNRVTSGVFAPMALLGVALACVDPKPKPARRSLAHDRLFTVPQTSEPFIALPKRDAYLASVSSIVTAYAKTQTPDINAQKKVGLASDAIFEAILQGKQENLQEALQIFLKLEGADQLPPGHLESIVAFAVRYSKASLLEEMRNYPELARVIDRNPQALQLLRHEGRYVIEQLATDCLAGVGNLYHDTVQAGLLARAMTEVRIEQAALGVPSIVGDLDADRCSLRFSGYFIAGH